MLSCRSSDESKLAKKEKLRFSVVASLDMLGSVGTLLEPLSATMNWAWVKADAIMNSLSVSVEAIAKGETLRAPRNLTRKGTWGRGVNRVSVLGQVSTFAEVLMANLALEWGSFLLRWRHRRWNFADRYSASLA